MKVHVSENSAGQVTLLWHCPACDSGHGVTVKRPEGEAGPVWTWNNDSDSPSIQPSVRVSGTEPLTEDQYQRVMRGESVIPRDTICHFHITAGKIEFCG